MNNTIRHLFYRTILFIVVSAIPLLCLAAKKKAAVDESVMNVEPSWSSYMLAYFLVILCVGLGLLVVAHPVHRRDKPMKREE